MNARDASYPELKVLVGATIEGAINQFLSLDEHTQQKLAVIDGKFIRLVIADLELPLVFHIEAPAIRLMNEYSGEVDTTIKTDSSTLMEMGIQKLTREPGSLHGKIEITGDIETGQSFKSILDSVSIDWEEHMSHFTGDVVAHQFFRTLHKFKQWGRESWLQFSQDSAAWLTDEQQLSPHKHELSGFSQEVNKTRNDVERLAARIHQLQQQLEQAPGK